ncbi:MAG TPA: hypothetical protein VEO95_13090 [Chthoniobacteraceae bacterium]|nr:hypothetical protein [Chthoniobacteraceae bacterium]
MSSGSRNEALEALLESKYELECCEEGDKNECARRFENCVGAILADHPKVSRAELIEAIGPRYREFKAARLQAQHRRETL